MTLLAVRVEGQQALEAKISGLSKALNTRDLLDQSAALLLHNIMQRFLQQVDTKGDAWEDIKDSTKVQKMRRWGGGGILFASGKLFHSLQVFQVGDESRGIGTDVPYGKFHQFGTVNMARREFLGFSGPDVQVVQDLIVRRVSEALGG